MKVTKTSMFSGKDHTVNVNVTVAELYAWQIKGEKIQDAMPHLTPDEREFLMTGVMPDEWDEAFG